MKHFSEESHIDTEIYGSLWEDEYDHIFSNPKLHHNKRNLDEKYKFDFEHSFEDDEEFD